MRLNKQDVLKKIRERQYNIDIVLKEVYGGDYLNITQL